jgi:type VI protein secretion system component VasK
MIDVFDIFAFVVFGVLVAAVLVIVVGLGSLPGSIARKRGHPQAAAINVASWLGLATAGLLWPLALIWAFWVPQPTRPSELAPEQQPQLASDSAAKEQLAQIQARVDSLQAALRELQSRKEAVS